MKIHQLLVVVVNLLCLSSLATGSSHLQSPSTSLLVPSDASALLAFKYKADLGNKLEFSANKSFRFCKWKGVQCAEKKVVRVTFEGLSLGGIFPPNTLSKLDQLRVLSLQNNSLTGPIPDLSSLVNLKVLFLDHNLFTGSIPLSIFTLHRLKTLDLSYNNLTGSLPISVNNLNRLYYLRLDSNRINGSVPPLNQSSLQIFNISHNTLSGPIPVTKTLSRFKTASFSDNKGLCGEIIHKECRPIQPFFSPSTDAATKIKPPPPKTPAELGQNEDLQNGVALKSKENKTHKRYLLIIGVSTACLVLICSVILLALATKKHKNSKKLGEKTQKGAFDPSVSGNAEAVMRIEEDNNELEEKVKRVQQGMQQVIGKSGSLMFCAGEVQVYTLEQLMRASAELLGRGTMGTTYKAVLDNRLIVCVKRLDGGRLAGTSKEEFEHERGHPSKAYITASKKILTPPSLIHSTHSPPQSLPHFPSETALFADIQKPHHDPNAIYPFGDSECEYGRVYVYNLPSKFNKDLALTTCDDLDPWKWQCGLVTNDGYGKRSTDLAGILPGNLSAAWYRTNQFSSEVIFHYRLLNYRCRTNDPDSATAFYIPFYAGQAVGKYLWTDEIENRDLLSNKVLKWVQRQKYWKRYNGSDHFLTLGRITWDFRRLGDPEKLWGSTFLNRPQMQNVSRFTIERAPWDANDISVPYPTGFHPHSEKELREWQNFVLSYNRTSLFTFIGAARGDINSDFRSRLMSYCRNESDSCRVVDCAVTQCSNGSSEIQEALLSSDFCLQPKGDSLTRRSVFDCMVTGSVPVFFWRRTAYTQYQWFLPEEPGSYSVFIDPEAVRNGTASIKEILKSYSKDQVRKMREKVVETIPRIVYARPSGGLGTIKDAFEIAVEGVLKRVKDENEWKEYVDMGS